MTKQKYIIALGSIILLLASCSIMKDKTQLSQDEVEWTVQWDNSPGNRKPRTKIKTERPISNRGNNSKPITSATTTTTSSNTIVDYTRDWIGVPYAFGGSSKKGVDCSGFVCTVYKDVYGISLPRRSQDIEKETKTIRSKSKIRSGDLVFFTNNRGVVNHVGIYLSNNTFVHASTSKGVMISNLNDSYWKPRFKCAGRHPELDKN